MAMAAYQPRRRPGAPSVMAPYTPTPRLPTQPAPDARNPPTWTPTVAGRPSVMAPPQPGMLSGRPSIMAPPQPGMLGQKPSIMAPPQPTGGISPNMMAGQPSVMAPQAGGGMLAGQPQVMNPPTGGIAGQPQVMAGPTGQPGQPNVMAPPGGISPNMQGPQIGAPANANAPQQANPPGPKKGYEETGKIVADPWQPFQDPLKRVGGKYEDLLNSGDPFTMGDTTRDALDRMRGLAMEGDPSYRQSQNVMRGLLSDANGGLSSDIENALNPAWKIAQGTGGVTTGNQYNQLFGDLGKTTYSENVGGELSRGGVPLGDAVAGGMARGTLGLKTGGQYQDIIGRAGQPTLSGQVGGDLAGGVGTTEDELRGLIGGGGAGRNVMGQIARQGAGLTGLANEARGGAAEDYLTGTARGDYAGASNPHLEAALNPQLKAAEDQIKDMFAASGRFGNNAAMNKVLGETLGGIRANAAMGNYERERDRQLGAAQGLEGAQQGRLGLRSGMLSGDTGIRLGAAEGLETAEQGRTGLNAGILGDIFGQRAGNAGIRLGAAGQADQSGMSALDRMLAGTSGLTGVQGQNLGFRAQGENTINDNRFRNADLRLGAAGQADQIRQGNRGLQLDALGGRTGVDAQNVNNRLNASGMLSGEYQRGLDRQLSAMDRLPMLDQLRYSGVDRLFDIGQAEEGYGQREADAYTQFINSLQGVGGTQTQMEPRKPGRKALGFLTSLLGMF